MYYSLWGRGGWSFWWIRHSLEPTNNLSISLVLDCENARWSLHIILVLEISVSCFAPFSLSKVIQFSYNTEDSSNLPFGLLGSVIFAVVSRVEWHNLPSHTGGKVKCCLLKNKNKRAVSRKSRTHRHYMFQPLSFSCCALIRTCCRMTARATWVRCVQSTDVMLHHLHAADAQSCDNTLSLTAIWSSRHIRCLMQLLKWQTGSSVFPSYESPTIWHLYKGGGGKK